jgi:hypothetical protein
MKKMTEEKLDAEIEQLNADCPLYKRILAVPRRFEKQTLIGAAQVAQIHAARRGAEQLLDHYRQWHEGYIAALEDLIDGLEEGDL